MEQKETKTEAKDEDTISNYIDTINNSIEAIRSSKEELKNTDIPSNFKISMTGAKDSRVLDFIFDTKLDYTIDAMVNKFMEGDYSDIDRYGTYIEKAFELMGIGKGAFEGPVSQTVMRNVMNSINTIDFSKAKGNIKRCFMIVKNLKRQAKEIPNRDMRKKYLDSVYALKQILRYASKIYKNRKLVTDRVKIGMHTLVMEGAEPLSDYGEALTGFEESEDEQE
jgi:hypothetical protein